MPNLGWDDQRHLVPVTRDDAEENIGWRTTGVDSLHAIWPALDRYHAMIRRVLETAGVPVPSPLGEVPQVAPWVPEVVIGSLAEWTAAVQTTRRTGRVAFSLLIDEHRRISAAHYQRAVNPVAVTLHLKAVLPAVPLDDGRFRAHCLTVTAPYVSDDRTGSTAQWGAALAILWNQLADSVEGAIPLMLAACARRGAVT